jgi:C4-type Zn-finger protein
MLKYVFDMDRQHCPNCGVELKIVAEILEQPLMDKVLKHLVLEARAPALGLPVDRSSKRPD